MDEWALASRWLAVAAAAVTVRLLDDLLDAPLDREGRDPNWTARLGTATAAYAVVALAVAAALDVRAASACALAAYGVGMLREPRGRMPSGLAAWQETALAGALCLCGGGVALGTTALLSLMAVDLADDLADHPGTTVPCFGTRWPRPAAWSACGALAAAALALDVSLAVPVLTCGAVAIAARARGPSGRRARGDAP